MTIEPKAQHTPIRISPDDPVVIETESGEFFATTLPYDGDLAFAGDYERAELIVRAVNSHAALVEALEELESMRYDLVDILKQAEAHGVPNAFSAREWLHGTMYEKSRRALVAAKGA